MPWWYGNKCELAHTYERHEHIKTVVTLTLDAVSWYARSWYARSLTKVPSLPRASHTIALAYHHAVPILSLGPNDLSRIAAQYYCSAVCSPYIKQRLNNLDWKKCPAASYEHGEKQIVWNGTYNAIKFTIIYSKWKNYVPGKTYDIISRTLDGGHSPRSELRYAIRQAFIKQ